MAKFEATNRILMKMKKSIIIISVLALSISCTDTNKIDNNAETENMEISDNTTNLPVLTIAEFEVKAAEWVDKEVQVNGIVDHVCKHGGKKLFLVSDDADVHVVSETRFDDALIGNEITVTGIVQEFRVDEAYCLLKEEDHIQNHKEGTDSDEVYDQKIKEIQSYRDSMKVAGVDHLSFYSLSYVSHQINE